MADSDATTVGEYLASLDDERRETIGRVRDVVLATLPDGYVEEIAWGMIAYNVPLERYPSTYNGKPLMYAALAAQKRYCSIYLTNVYGDPARLEQFEARYRATGKPLDMGKSCVRFKTLDDLPLDVIGETIASTPVDEFLAIYEASRAKTVRG